jgi:hypothetical protein
MHRLFAVGTRNTRRFTTLVLLGVICLPAQALAAVVCSGTGTIASSCSGVDYLGTTYDVTWALPDFPTGPTPIFNPTGDPGADAAAIVAAINSALDIGGFVNIEYDTGSGTSTEPTCSGACYYVAYRINSTTVSAVESRYVTSPTTGWINNAITNKSHADQNTEATAVFTPTVVPIPASVWLFGSGLFGIIAIARRKKMA